MWNCLPQDFLAGKDIDAKVKAVLLSYPVIYNDSHVGTFKNLLGITDVENDPMANALSLDRTVNADNPPCFIWTTATDKCVNPMATVKYVEAYLKAGISVECHMWPYGGHGAATCDGRTNENYEDVFPAREWLDLADRFICKLK
jgi:acetyl esterase/lipase